MKESQMYNTGQYLERRAHRWMRMLRLISGTPWLATQLAPVALRKEQQWEG